MTSVTQEAADFVATLTLQDVSPDVLALSRRCVLDGLAVTTAGTEEPVVEIIDSYIARIGGKREARSVAHRHNRVSTPHAALRNGVAGHAMDWDDTQLAEGKGRVFGLLTHPTIPPLSAGLAIAEMLGGVPGSDFLAGFLAGFEVECKLAACMAPNHYLRGFHSSGTLGTFGATATAAKLMGLNRDETAQAFGIAASMAAGIRANFGTMVKPLHVGRAAENGVAAALLAQIGCTASPTGLDEKWGYLTVAGGNGADIRLAAGRFGNPFSIVDPGVSIKPYPCGVLTHPTMDAMRDVMRESNLKGSDISTIEVHAGRNILDPIRYSVARTGLEGKFCMPFLLSAIVLRGKAGKAEFRDEFVLSGPCQEMQARIRVQRDPAIEELGFERIRSRIEVTTCDGRVISKIADERYRGGPEKPLSVRELREKVLDCMSDLVEPHRIEAVVELVDGLDVEPDVTRVLSLLEIDGEYAVSRVAVKEDSRRVNA
jgi:2-methylcitrate dehydratase PrpD